MTANAPDAVRNLVIAAAEDGERLDRVLASAHHRPLALAAQGADPGRPGDDRRPHGPRSRRSASTPATRSRSTVPPPEPAEPRGRRPSRSTSSIEDDAIIVIDKPAGLVVHPAAGNWTGTLVNALIAHCGDSLSGIGGVQRPGHRAPARQGHDRAAWWWRRPTARTARSAAQFADHGRTGPLERGYLAFVWGVPARPKGHNRPADRPPPACPRQDGGARGRARGGDPLGGAGALCRAPTASRCASLLACRLETGRTHQIRVHLAAIGHPLLGDEVYGRASRPRRVTARTRGHATRWQPLADRPCMPIYLAFEHPVTGEFLRVPLGTAGRSCSRLTLMPWRSQSGRLAVK